MKTVYCLLIISGIEIFTSCQAVDIKHYEPQRLKKFQILNPRKYLKGKSDNYQKWNLKNVNRKEPYTVFPAIAGTQQFFEKKDTPLFQQQHEQKTVQRIRVKKVLPDDLFKVKDLIERERFRRKRSVKKHDHTHVSHRNITIKNHKKNHKDSKKNDAVKRNATTKNSIKKKKNKSSYRMNKTILKVAAQKVNDEKNTVTVNSEKKNRIKANNGTSRTPRLKYTKKDRKRGLRNSNRTKVEKSHKRHARVKNLQKKLKRQEKRDGRRLIAGRDATIADYPYVVSIQKSREHWCAGALLNPRLVITTANCVWKSTQLSRLRVRAGSRHADRGGQTAKIKEVMKHPKWSIRRNPDNDVALLLLDRNIKFSDSVHSLDLPNHAMMPAFDDAWVTSWGAERRDGIFENAQFTLQVFKARLMDHAKCNNVTQRFGITVTENFICLSQTGRRAPCTRDTGAPAVSDGILWGLASWGIRKLCGTERFPAMFSYTASPSNMDFITNATHRLMSDQRHYPFPDRFPIQRSDTTPSPATGPIDYMYD